jgi:predicted ATPase
VIEAPATEAIDGAMERFIVISGCSSGGKSTLVAELRRRGHAVVEEPGRRIVNEEMKRQGFALPWVDAVAFARRAMALALSDLKSATALMGWVFFDRSWIDAASALEHLTGEQILMRLAQTHRYHRRVFLAPPWPEIYVTDAERHHGFDVAAREYSRLVEAYSTIGYEVQVLPKVGVSLRADLVLSTLPGQQ